jgi:DNA ligase-1
MKFLKFVTYLQELETTRSRNDMVVILAKMYKEMDLEEVAKATYLIQGRVAPAFLPIEFSFSNKLIIKAMGSLMKDGVVMVQKEFKSLGDIGLVAEKIHTNRSKGLGLSEVYTTLEKFPFLTGKNSQAEKAQRFIELGKSVGGLELKYITRILVGSLRLGLSIKTVLDGLSWAMSGSKENRDLVERGYGVRCDLGAIAEIALGLDPLTKLKKIKTEAGVPVAAKLVEREKTLEDIIKRMSKCYVQPKYDGLRVQIHYSKKGFAKFLNNHDITLFNETGDEKADLSQHVRIFSRNFEDLTKMFPELALDLLKFNVDSIILDGEAVGFDPQSNEFLAFQDTIKRKRKYDIVDTVEKFPVEVHVFDILELFLKI